MDSKLFLIARYSGTARSMVSETSNRISLPARNKKVEKYRKVLLGSAGRLKLKIKHRTFVRYLLPSLIYRADST